jgi:dipeptidyl aminopeptidase/acylaminoacyl peptidase
MSRAIFQRVLVTVVLLSAATNTFAGGSQADYDRAKNLEASTRGKIIRTRITPHWFDAGNQFWYRIESPSGGKDYYVVNALLGTREPVFDRGVVTKALSDAIGKTIAPDTFAPDPISFSDSDRLVHFEAAEKIWSYDRTARTLTEQTSQSATTDPSSTMMSVPSTQREREAPTRFNETSPDGRWRAEHESGKLSIVSTKTKERIELDGSGKEGDGYDGRFLWSPDSNKLVALWTKDGDHRRVYLVQSSPPDQLQPKLLSYEYLKPGDAIPLTKPHLFDIASRKQISVSDELFTNPWDADRWDWDPDSSRFIFLYNQRSHQVVRIVAVDATSGHATAVINEQSKTFIDYDTKLFYRYFPTTNEMIWMSERDGWNHLYLYDAHTGQVKNQITRGQWVVRGVDRVDEANRQIWFRAGGIYPDQDPYYIHYCRVNFDGTGMVVMTAGNGTHSIQYSPDRRFIIDTYSRVDMPPVNELRRVSDGSLVCAVEQSDLTPLLKIGWKTPEPFVAKGRDGKTDIYGVIFRPTNFDPNVKYPVVEDIYAGPQDSFVPKEFSSFHSQQRMAELGFIVVKIDGMGTSNRSKAFHDVCYKNLGDAGFPDRILWMKAAAVKYPYMDLTRVGLYGTSAGGQSAVRALEAFNDFYKVAVADCGCHDNRMDKIWWNELWMGWPVGPEYAAQSNVTNAPNLKGKLFLIVGELDHNVDPASTMQVVNALIKANKDFDLLVIPNADHGQDGTYGARRRQDFLVRNLLGVEPRHVP